MTDQSRIKRLEDALRPFADLSENKRYLEVTLAEEDFHRAHDVLYAEIDSPADLHLLGEDHEE